MHKRLCHAVHVFSLSSSYICFHIHVNVYNRRIKRDRDGEECNWNRNEGETSLSWYVFVYVVSYTFKCLLVHFPTVLLSVTSIFPRFHAFFFFLSPCFFFSILSRFPLEQRVAHTTGTPINLGKLKSSVKEKQRGRKIRSCRELNRKMYEYETKMLRRHSEKCRKHCIAFSDQLFSVLPLSLVNSLPAIHHALIEAMDDRILCLDWNETQKNKNWRFVSQRDGKFLRASPFFGYHVVIGMKHEDKKKKQNAGSVFEGGKSTESPSIHSVNFIQERSSF